MMESGPDFLFLFNFIFRLECDTLQLNLTSKAGTASQAVHLCSAAPSWMIYLWSSIPQIQQLPAEVTAQSPVQ